MRIVSQDKEFSTNMDLCELSIEQESVYCRWSDGTIHFLGRYENHNRAVEVFLEIHNYFYKPLTADDINKLMSGNENENNYDLFWMPEE